MTRYQNEKSNLLKSVECINEALRNRTIKDHMENNVFQGKLFRVINNHLPIKHILLSSHPQTIEMMSRFRSFNINAAQQMFIIHSKQILADSLMRLRKFENPYKNVIKSLELYEEVSKVITKTDHPIEYSDNMHNCSVGYKFLYQNSDDDEYYSSGVNCLKEALIIRTIGNHPEKYAESMELLGILSMMRFQKLKNKSDFENGISQLGKALEFYTIEEYPIRYISIEMNIVNGIMIKSKMEKSIDGFLDSIEKLKSLEKIINIAKNPQECACLFHSYGVCFSYLGSLRKDSTDFLKSIDFYTRELEIRTISEHPLEHASTQVCLANTLIDIFLLDNDEKFIHQAIAAYDIALGILKSNNMENDISRIGADIRQSFNMIIENTNNNPNVANAIEIYKTRFLQYLQ